MRAEEKKPGFSLQLLQITATDSYPYNTRLASALFFKNFIKRNWTDEDGNYKLPLDEVATIKQELISLMISVPAGIQTQLGEAVSVIADSDFWERWDTLVDVSKVALVDFLFLTWLRISFQDYNPRIQPPTTVFCKLRIRYSKDGDPCSSRMSCIRRLTMSWRDLELPS